MDNKENSLYSVSKVKCNNCSHAWIAVRPQDTFTEIFNVLNAKIKDLLLKHRRK